MTQTHGSGPGSYGTGAHTAGTSTTGHGTGYNAGPHDSNLANKADPRGKMIEHSYFQHSADSHSS